MDKLKIETQQKKLVVPGREFGGEQPLDIRVTLPEYLGDVVRVLRCTVFAVPGNVSAADDRITAEGEAQAHVVYLSDRDGICVYDTAEPFTKSVEAPDFPADASVIPVFLTDRPVCRAVSPRSLEIKTAVRMSFRICERRERVLLTAATGGGVELKTAEFTVTDTVNVSSKQIGVDETCALAAEHNAVRRLLCSDAACRVNETRVITNKAMVRGEIEYSVFYLPDGADSPESARLSVPFSEIVECAGLNDTMNVTVGACLLSHEVCVRSAKTAARELNCTAAVSLTLTAEQADRVAAATDAFSTECEIDAEFTEIWETCDSRAVAETVTADGRFDLTRLQPRRILYHTERVGAMRAVSSEKGAVLRGTLTVGLFTAAEDGAIAYAENDVEFTFEKTVPAQAEQYVFSPAVTVNAADVTLDGGTAVLRAELFVEGRIDARRKTRVLSGAALRENSVKKSSPGLVIYFPDKGEQLWDIAKSYGASPAALRADNKLEDDALPAGRPLLIARI